MFLAGLGASCKPGFEVECKVTGKCISSSLVCNGQHDCGSGDTSDESGCPGKLIYKVEVIDMLTVGVVVCCSSVLHLRPSG